MIACGTPQAAVDRLGHARLDLVQCVGIVRFEETSNILVAEISVEERVEMMIFHRARRSGEGEKVIDGCRDLEAALVAMTHHTCEPFRIGGAGMNDAADLFLEGSDARSLGPRMVVVIDDRRRARDVSDRGGEPALE